MNPDLLELAQRHGGLRARIAAQRERLAGHAAPIESALARGDAVLDGVDWLKHHPVAIGAAVMTAVVLRPSRAWRWARRGFFVWKGWQALRASLFGRA